MFLVVSRLSKTSQGGIASTQGHNISNNIVLSYYRTKRKSGPPQSRYSSPKSPPNRPCRCSPGQKDLMFTFLFFSFFMSAINRLSLNNQEKLCAAEVWAFRDTPGEPKHQSSWWGKKHLLKANQSVMQQCKAEPTSRTTAETHDLMFTR